MTFLSTFSFAEMSTHTWLYNFISKYTSPLNHVVEMRFFNQIPPVCPPPGEDPEDWVDCLEGRVRGTATPCATACGGQCCQGIAACKDATACIKKDGSCDGYKACSYAGYSTGRGNGLYPQGYFSFYNLKISGPSCVGYEACENFNKNIYNTKGNAEMSLTNSCLCDAACRFHCQYSSAPLVGLPACGESIVNVGGQSSSSCAVSCFSFSLPTFCSNAANNLITTSASLLYSISRAAKRISIVETLDHSIVDTLEHPVRFVEPI